MIHALDITVAGRRVEIRRQGDGFIVRDTYQSGLVNGRWFDYYTRDFKRPRPAEDVFPSVLAAIQAVRRAL